MGSFLLFGSHRKWNDPDFKEGKSSEENMQSNSVYNQFVELISLSMIIISLGSLLILWALYNQYRFRTKSAINSAESRIQLHS